MTCECHVATMRTYRELRELGDTEGNAYAAAVRVFRQHHPETPRIDALQQVADWLDSHEANAGSSSTGS